MPTMSAISRTLEALERRMRQRRTGDVVHVVREGDPPEALARAQAAAEARGARLIVIRVVRAGDGRDIAPDAPSPHGVTL